MRIEHIALWTPDLERSKDFYIRYFNGTAGDKYTNPTSLFQSYFIRYEDGSRLEIMNRPTNHRDPGDTEDNISGLAHFAISVGSRERVDRLTERLRSDGYRIIRESRTTGDGYYESVILDPDDNRIEITI
ncbi:MAG TPA: VOC family protein [Bacillota bacterium]|nr:VOC family protein [Bacillota bacterium]